MKRYILHKKGIVATLIICLLIVAFTGIVQAATDKSDTKKQTGILTIKNDLSILQSGKEKFILSLLPQAGRDSLAFHPVEGDTLSVIGYMNKNVLMVNRVNWKGTNYVLRDSLNQPVWKGTSTHADNFDKCIGCNLCVVFCPNNAITLEKVGGANKAVIDQAKCSGCNICISGNNAKFMGCPTKAITK